MNLKSEVELKFRKFIKKYWKTIVIVTIVVIIIIGIDRLIKLSMNDERPKTTYTPDVPILDSSASVPKKVQKTTEEFIDEYVNYCNNKEYESAYAMLSNECRDDYFGSIEYFKKYVDKKYFEPRKYAIESYSIYKDKYVYNLKLFDDILATGLTGKKYSFQEDKILVGYNDKNELVFNVGGFIEKNEIQSVQENQYLKVDVKYQIKKYEFENYHIKVTNKSPYTVIIRDGNTEEKEVLINLGEELRVDENAEAIILKPGETKEFSTYFQKFWDDGDETKEIQFTSVRIMDENDNLIDKMSMRMGF